MLPVTACCLLFSAQRSAYTFLLPAERTQIEFPG
jgi:hypothetical protein